MFAGPIIARELVTTPRPWRYYLWRASFSCALFILLWTAWQSIIGWQDVRELGVLARFGGVLYVMFALLQLTLMLFFAPLSTAAAVAYEKDRRTFNLLLMTSLSDTEIVVGKLVAGLLNILIILGASVGLLSLCALLGGISFGQVANLFAVTAASGVAGGAMGLLIALWRDRTFQSISLTILMVVFSVAGVELFAVAFPTLEFMGVPLKEVLNPYRAMIALLYPRADQITGVVRASSLVYIGVRLTFAALIVAFGTWKLRTWNPGRSEPREQGDEAEVEVESRPRSRSGDPKSTPSSRSPLARPRRRRQPWPRLLAAASRCPVPLMAMTARCRKPETAALRSMNRRARPRVCMSRAGRTGAWPPCRGPTAGPGPTRSSGVSS